MSVRALDADHDWTFGKGRNDYKYYNNAVQQNIQTRVLSFLGDCFFATNKGIDWFNLLGTKDDTNLLLAIAAQILNDEEVTGLLQLSANTSTDRVLTVSYQVQTVYSTVPVSGDFTYNFNNVVNA